MRRRNKKVLLIKNEYLKSEIFHKGSLSQIQFWCCHFFLLLVINSWFLVGDVHLAENVRICVSELFCSVFVKNSQKFGVICCNYCSILCCAVLEFELQLRKMVSLEWRELSNKLLLNIEPKYIFLHFFNFYFLRLLLFRLWSCFLTGKSSLRIEIRNFHKIVRVKLELSLVFSLVKFLLPILRCLFGSRIFLHKSAMYVLLQFCI